MRARPGLCSWIIVVATACSPPDKPEGEHEGAGADAAPGGGGGGSDPALDAAVYAHSASDLYKVDPDTLEVMHVAPFAWPTQVFYDQMTDIALDKDGHMVGISFSRVYAVDKETGACTFLSMLDRSFNGLSFIPAGGVDSGAEEVLVAAAEDGSVYRLHPMTGMATPIGAYGGSAGSSGDVVSVAGFGTVATVTSGSSATDWLARIEPMTGHATMIGDTGVAGIWGLGFWGGKVYGFSSGNQFFLVDVTSGQATLVETAPVSWWGAGVTTSAPIVE